MAITSTTRHDSHRRRTATACRCARRAGTRPHRSHRRRIAHRRPPGSRRPRRPSLRRRPKPSSPASVLLTFAFAWLALAVLSQRWTDQPQRWAFVPAAFMASPAQRAGARTDRQRARMGVAASRDRACGVDDRAQSARPPQPHAPLDRVPRVRRAGALVHRRRVRDLPRIDGHLPDGRPTDRRRRPQASHRLHRHRQPNRRARARPG